MKKMTTKRVNAIIASALAMTLAIPSSVFIGGAKVAAAEPKAADDLPKPVATYDFERGFKEAGYGTNSEGQPTTLSVKADKAEQVTEYYKDASGYAVVKKNDDGTPAKRAVSNQPFITYDEERGNVFMLQDTITTVEAYTEPIVSVSGDGTPLDASGKAAEKTKDTVGTFNSGATITNPFKKYKEELIEEPEWDNAGDHSWQNGVTISMWVKATSLKDASGAPVKVDPDSSGSAVRAAKDSSLISIDTEAIPGIVHKDDAAKYKILQIYQQDTSDDRFKLGETNGQIAVKYKTTCTVDKFKETKYKDENDKEVKIATAKWNINKRAITDKVSTGCSVELSKIVEVGGLDGANTNPDDVSTNTVEAFKKLGVNDTIIGKNGEKFTVIKADSAAGKITVESEVIVAKPMTIYTGFGYWIRFNSDYKDKAATAAYLKPTTVDGDTTYTVQAVGAYAGSDQYMDLDSEDCKVRVGTDNAGLMFTLGGCWGFGQSQQKITATYGNKGQEVNNVQMVSSNQAYAHAKTKNQNLADNVADYVPESIVNNADEWHFVTYVITNDHVSTYYNGELMDEKLYYAWGTKGVSVNNNFNLGAGYISETITNLKSNTHTYADVVAEDGTVPKSPNNELGIHGNNEGLTVMEVLTQENSVIHLGGLSTVAAEYSMNYGTAYGTMIDDLKFYIEPMTSEQVAQLYEQESKTSEANLEPIATYDFEGEDAANQLVQPSYNLNGKRDEVSAPAIVKGGTIGGQAVKLVNGNRKEACALKLENPYKGMTDLKGATVSYWVSEEVSENNAVKDTPVLSFFDVANPQKVHNVKNETDTEAASILYTSTSGTAKFIEGYSDTSLSGSLKNTFTNLPDTDKALDAGTVSKWHYVTMVMTNKEVLMYKDGELVENTLNANFGQDGAKPYGPRFYDGYWGAMDDLAKGEIFGGTNNHGSTTLMGFLTNNATDVYLNFTTLEGSTSMFFSDGGTIYVDDVTFYATAMTEQQVKDAYDKVKSAKPDGVVEPEEVIEPDVPVVDPDDPSGEPVDPDDPSGEPVDPDDPTGGPVTGDPVTGDAVYGDATEDGKINTSDALRILRYTLGKATLTEQGKKNADVNLDGKINTSDALRILRYTLGKAELGVK